MLSVWCFVCLVGGLRVCVLIFWFVLVCGCVFVGSVRFRCVCVIRCVCVLCLDSCAVGFCIVLDLWFSLFVLCFWVWCLCVVC